MNKSILEVLHETAKDFHEAGAMDDVTMREFDALCLPPVKNTVPFRYSGSEIFGVRAKTLLEFEFDGR